MRRVLAAHPDQFKAMAYLGEFLSNKIRVTRQIFHNRRAPTNSGAIGDVALSSFSFLNACSGGEKKLTLLIPCKPDRSSLVTMRTDRRCIRSLLGERQQAIAWLRRAVQVGNHNYPWFRRDKNWDSLRNDPRLPEHHGRSASQLGEFTSESLYNVGTSVALVQGVPHNPSARDAAEATLP